MNIAQARLASNFALAAIEGNNKEVTATLDQLKKDAGNDPLKISDWSWICRSSSRWCSRFAGKNIRSNLKSQH